MMLVPRGARAALSLPFVGAPLLLGRVVSIAIHRAMSVCRGKGLD